MKGIRNYIVVLASLGALASTASADTTDGAVTTQNLIAIKFFLQPSQSSITVSDGKIVFTPSAGISSFVFNEGSPTSHQFAFTVPPIPLGDSVGTVEVVSAGGTNFDVALDANGIEFTADLSAQLHVTTDWLPAVLSGYKITNFDISVPSATLSANASLNAAGTGGGIHFNAPVVNAPFSVSNCTAVKVSPGVPIPFAGIPVSSPVGVVPCDDIVKGVINASGGIGQRVSDGLGTALVANWKPVVSNIRKGLDGLFSSHPGFGNLQPGDSKWKVVDGTMFTEAPCRVGKSGLPCLAFEATRMTTEAPICKIVPDSCDYGATLTCAKIHSKVGEGDSLQMSAMPTGDTVWHDLVSPQGGYDFGGDQNGDATVHVQVLAPNGGGKTNVKFRFENLDAKQQQNSAVTPDAQIQTVTLNGAWCHPGVCTDLMTCKLVDGTTFVTSAQNQYLCSQKKGKLVKTKKCTNPS